MKRAATAPTVPALIQSRHGRRSNINPTAMEVTMVTSITPAPRPAIPEPDVIVMLSISPKPWGGEGAPQKWDATLNGEPLVTRQRDPEHAVCRALVKRGITGRVTFVHARTGMPGLSMNIEGGAKLVTHENDRGLYTAKFKPFDATVLGRSGDRPSARIILPDGHGGAPNHAPAATSVDEVAS